MGFSLRSFATITICFALIVVQSSEELIVLRHPSTAGDSERQLTCVSEDDDAALIWVHRLASHGSLTDFQPRKPKFKSDTQCAIWDSTDCMARWEYNSKWDVVESSLRPMGPIFDYRWEGFKEFVFEKDLKEEDYHYVGNVNDSSQTTVFSVRGSRDIYIFLCANKDPMQGPCLWIILDGGRKRISAIKSCSNGAPKPSSPDNHCTEIVKVSHGIGDAIQLYEWRTFTLKWISKEKLIQVFRETDSENEPFLQGYLRKWNPMSHVSIRSDMGTRIRFHFYQYWLTENENSVLHTTKFNPQAENFCVELLVSLCPECTLNVSLIDADRGNLETWIIPMEENHRYNELMTWQSIKLSANVSRKKLKLEIQTILNEHASKGQWAIDSFRTCQSVPGLRKSTITIPKEGEGKTAFWPQVNCQKLSYNGSVVVDTRSKHTINNDTHQLEKLVNEWSASCGSSCRSFGEKWSICDSTGCSCSRGFSGSDCKNGCTSGYYGYDCAEKCGSCKYGSCDTISGNCANCKDNELLPPLCKEKRVPEVIPDIQDLEAYSPSNTTVELRWKPILPGTRGIVNYHVSIKLDKLIGCENLGIATPTQPVIRMTVRDANASITGLHPYAIYIATVSAYTTTYGKPTAVIFQTLESNTPASKVNNLRIEDENTTLKWDAPTDCTTITGPTKVTKIVFYSIANTSNVYLVAEKETSNRYFNLSELQLQAYTSYLVHVHVIRDFDRIANYSSYPHLRWVTPPAVPAPPAVKELEIYESDPNTNSISLRWVPPHPPNGELESYEVSIIPKNHILTKQTVRDSELSQDCKKKGNYTCFGRITLQPNAIANDTRIQVRAKNKNVEKSGDPSSVPLDPDAHIDVPGQPLSLTATPEAHGIVNLKWEHGFSYVKIVRFEINIDVQETKLQENITAKFPKMIHYFVSQGKRNYNTQLYLLPSTSYVISVIAVNEKNSRSSQAEVNVSSKVEVAFASEDKLQVTQKGVTINIEVPRVVNGTQRTMVSVKVKGFVECLEEQWQTPVLSSNVMEWTVEKYQPEAGRSKHLTIDPNRIPGAASNCSLNLGKIYEINAYVEDPFFELSASHIPSVITFIANGESRKSNFTWLVTIVPVLATCSLLIVFIYLYRIRRRASKQPREPSYLEIIPLSSIETTANDSSTHFHPDQGLRPQPDANEIQSSSHLYSLPKETDSCCVSVEYFQEYVKRAAASGLLHSQFMLLPKGFTRASDYAKLPANMPENRNRNLVPLYDDTRVVLEEISGDPYSDYINASYIKGYKKERAYIAAQGPTADTMKDFWRMVWQEEVHVICMLTNVISCTETKCEQYWPDFGTGMQYGDFFVLNSEEQVSADYTFRILELSHRQDTRIVKHLHYTRWPRLGIPVYPQTLVAYLKKLEQTPSGKGPIVVHCRFGDDRTGTLILCHICIHQAVAEKEIDVTATITKMRNSRADMVGTLQQYVLAHIIITESLVSLPTQISCSEVLSGGIRKMKMQLPSDIQRLNDTAWQEEVLRSSAAPRSPIAVANETLPELVADTPGVTYSNLSESEMKQFNAVSADGIKVKKQYLTSQLPSSFILSSFWRFVVEKNIKLIIILQCSDPRDPTCCDIMPNESIIGPVPHIQLENNQCLDEGEYSTTDRLLLTNTSEKSAKTRSVTVLTCREWGRGEYEKPPSPAALVSLWIASEKIPREEGQTLVLCDDGVTGCGLYLALSFLLERMALEGECDVISAVRTVRRSKMEFMQSLEQCEFLYDAAVSYAERFQTYANFS